MLGIVMIHFGEARFVFLLNAAEYCVIRQNRLLANLFHFDKSALIFFPYITSICENLKDLSYLHTPICMKLKCLVPLEDILLIMKLLHSIINFFLRMFYFFNYLVTSQGWIFIL